MAVHGGVGLTEGGYLRRGRAAEVIGLSLRAAVGKGGAVAMPQVRAQWPLTAREHELAVFTGKWRSPELRAVLVSGPAGVGKTRLAGAFLQLAAAGGDRVGRAAATATASAVPFGALAHLVPADIDLADPVGGFARVATALAANGEGGRSTVWVDDLHLLDSASAVLLRRLLDGDVVRLIGTVRSGAPISESVSALCHGDAVLRIELSAFDAEQVELVLRAVLGAPVARRAARDLAEASGGNALYLRELVQSALADGSLAYDGEVWRLHRRSGLGMPSLTGRI